MRTKPLLRLWHPLRQDLTHVVCSDGVSDALTGAGGSISLALYTATSIRVGILLGEGRAERAKAAAHAGLWSATAQPFDPFRSRFLLRAAPICCTL